jgi:hypothetical protein
MIQTWRMLGFVAALGLGVAAHAAPETGTRVDRARGAVERVEAEDPATARRVANSVSRCAARNNERSAIRVLDHPFASREQSNGVDNLLSFSQGCLNGGQMWLPPQVFVTGLAEHFLATRYSGADVGKLRGLDEAQIDARGLQPRNMTEDVALCIVTRAPELVRALVATTPASPEEAATLQRLAPHYPPCIFEGMELTFEPIASRSLLAVALYRALAKTEERR